MDLMKKLLAAVKKHSGMDEGEIKQAGEHGADAGWSGFTYYKDTSKFYDDYEDEIWELVCSAADDQGEPVLKFIASLGGAKNVESGHTFENLLAWFTLEEVGHYLMSSEESGETVEAEEEEDD